LSLAPLYAREEPTVAQKYQWLDYNEAAEYLGVRPGN
jgi:hypothetical protein